jgi:hypothetical protein
LPSSWMIGRLITRDRRRRVVLTLNIVRGLHFTFKTKKN